MHSESQPTIQVFAFSRGTLLLIVGFSLAAGFFGVLAEPSSGRFSTPVGLTIIRTLGVVFVGVALFHLPNLVRAVRGLPAVTIDSDSLRLHNFPSRVIPVAAIADVQWELGSLLLRLRSGQKKWLNLKIVEEGRSCADAIESRLKRGAEHCS